MAMKHKAISLISMLLTMLYTSSLYSNVIWPAAVVGTKILSGWFLVIISIIIEGLFLYRYIPAISYGWALLISCVGNIVSAILGTFLMTWAMLLWHFPFDTWLGGTFSIYNFIATYILMYLGSSMIELLTIKIIFHYTTNQLLVPILVGNLVTYGMAIIRLLMGI